MIHFKTDRRTRWPKMRESKLVDFIRYAFQPGFSLCVCLFCPVTVIAAYHRNILVISLYFGLVILHLVVSFFRWRIYRKM
jgi:hypothetical protein